jgi:lysophospholipase L1-like esterase
VGDIFDVSVSFNQQRFRGLTETSLEPAPGVLRIAAIGDSFTMGWGVEDGQTYPARLQSLLQQELGRPVEVLNAGVAGTGTGEQALYLQRWVGRFHPGIVVLAVNLTDLNDDRIHELFTVEAGGVAIPRSPEAIYQSHRRFRQFRGLVLSLPGFDFLNNHSRLFRLVRMVLWETTHRETIRYREEWIEPAKLNNALRLTAAEIRWLNAQVRNSGGRLFVVYLPMREAIYPPRTEVERLGEDHLAAMLQELCEKEQIPFADLTPAMRDEAAHAPQPVYYPLRDPHPSPRGYAVFAQQVAKLVGTQIRSSEYTPGPNGLANHR